MLKRNGVYGLAEVYVRCKEKGYTRSFGSMCRQIRKKGYQKPKIHRKSYTKYDGMDGKYPGEKVQVDIKYVPAECIKFPCYGTRYYQITVIDEYSRKRVLKIVKEKSTFELVLESLGIKLRRTRPYSPWQNGKVERSHREDGKILYNRRVFTSEKELIEQVEKHQRRYNKTAKTVLNFKSPNQVVAEFFQKCNICVDN